MRSTVTTCDFCGKPTAEPDSEGMKLAAYLSDGTGHQIRLTSADFCGSVDCFGERLNQAIRDAISFIGARRRGHE